MTLFVLVVGFVIICVCVCLPERFSDFHLLYTNSRLEYLQKRVALLRSARANLAQVKQRRNLDLNVDDRDSSLGSILDDSLLELSLREFFQSLLLQR